MIYTIVVMLTIALFSSQLGYPNIAVKRARSLAQIDKPKFADCHRRSSRCDDRQQQQIPL